MPGVSSDLSGSSAPGHHSEDSLGAAPPFARLPRVWAFQARLFGGPAAGFSVTLTEPLDEIAVFWNSTGLVVTDARQAGALEAEGLIGLYELVGPAGPEVPVYVPTA